MLLMGKEIHRNFVYLNQPLPEQQLRWCRPLETLSTVCTCVYPEEGGQEVWTPLENHKLPYVSLETLEGGPYSHLYKMLMTKNI